MTSLIQDSLSTAQAIPLLGVPVSVVKAAFSAIEMVASLALLLLSSPFGEASKDLSAWSAFHLKEGWEGLVYAFANMMTLGIYGTIREYGPNDSGRTNIGVLYQKRDTNYPIIQ